MRIAGRSIVVAQLGGSCRISVPENVQVGADESSIQLAVDTNLVDCQWSIASLSDWITLSPATGVGTATVTVNVAANPLPETRTGRIAIAEHTIHVSQAAGECGATVDPSSHAAPHDGGVVTLRVEVLERCPWEIVGVPSWLRLAATSGVGPRSIHVDVERNDSQEERRADLRIGDETFTIQQSGSPECAVDVLSVAQAPPEGGSLSLEVGAPSECQWEVVSSESWIRIDSPTIGEGVGTVVLALDPNPSDQPRVGTVRVGPSVVSVQQAGRSTAVVVSVKLIVDKDGERSRRGRYVTDAQILNAMAQANRVLARNGASWSLVVEEIVEVDGISEFRILGSTADVRGLESAARAEPTVFHWRDDAINVYIVEDLPAGGVCSFPPGGEIIVINNRRGILNDGIGWLHEFGHYFSLTHTFECFARGCDPSICTGYGASHGGDRGLRTCPDVCPHDTNVMSYEFIGVDDAVFSACQLDEMEWEMRDPSGSRISVTRQPEATPESPPAPLGVPFRLGDPNSDGSMNITDALNVLGHLFSSGDLSCAAAGDVDADGTLNISDATAILLTLFSSRGPEFARPGPDFCSPSRNGGRLALECEYDQSNCPAPEVAPH